MALSASALSALIKTGLLTDTHVTNNASLQKLCDSIASAVVSHITSAAVVNSLGLIAPPGAGGGPVTGASTIS